MIVAPFSWLHRTKDPKQCGSYRAISLVAYAGNVLLRVNADRLKNNGEREDILQEEGCGIRQQWSTIDMLSVL